MGIIKTVRSHLFLASVSMAAIVHSSWSFSTFFSGVEPQPQFTPRWFAWLLPGLLLAFSVDIGLLSMASEIRAGDRAKGRLAAFAVLCIAMMFLQFLYIITHIPKVELGEGVRAEWVWTITLFRDACVWVFPFLLPLALGLFTFPKKRIIEHERTAPQSLAMVAAPSHGVELVAIEESAATEKIEIECFVDGCGWAGSYDSQLSATNALSAHQRIHSIAQPSNASNGNGRHEAH